MESYVLDWVNLLLRWAHVIVAIAWIGASFYFVFLDSNLTPPSDESLKQQGVSGELWAVHGGGFYHPVKFGVAPATLPTHLHWFYWESYSTWLTGFALFAASYLWNANTYLIDKSLVAWTPSEATVVALAFLGVFWIFYDLVCRLFGAKQRGDTIVGLLVALLVCIASWLACQWFAGRAAFLLVGAMLATAMTANVFFWIIPGQRKVIAQLKAGELVNPIHGQRGKQRSVHNTYFTLPVVFAMLSNHYSFLYTHKLNWVVLVLMMFAGAAIRQFFVLRHGYKLGRNAHPWPYVFAGCTVLVLTAVWLRPEVTPLPSAVAASQPVRYAEIQKVFEQRCYLCHAEQVQMKNIRVDSPQALSQHAQAVYQQVVVGKLMPMNNTTGITEQERDLVKRWYEGGAKLD